MKITVLTPSYNQGHFIEETIQSVLNQGYPDVEHIVLDGGSTDNTVEILKKYPAVRWISEKDEGQADALEKGLKMATGDIIGWVNSDDYYEPGALKSIAEFFETSKADWVIGNISLVSEHDKTITPIKSPRINKPLLLSDPDRIRQPGTFFRTQALLKAGGFNKKYHYTMDLDLWFRMLKISDPVMLDENIAYFRWHSGQKTSIKVINNQKKEILDVLTKNGATLLQRKRLVFRKFMQCRAAVIGDFIRKIKSKKN